jgi:hypothetical protein
MTTPSKVTAHGFALHSNGLIPRAASRAVGGDAELPNHIQTDAFSGDTRNPTCCGLPKSMRTTRSGHFVHLAAYLAARRGFIRIG